jgi:hypothetical protein
MELIQHPEGKRCLRVAKCSRKEPCHHQLHVALGSLRATAPSDTNLMDSGPINDGDDWISLFVATPWFQAAKAKVASYVIFVAAADLAFVFITVLLYLVFFKMGLKM